MHLHNTSAISHSALALSSPTLLHAVFGVKKPLLIGIEFNAGMFRLLPYSTGCFDIALHFSVCLCAAFLSFGGESVKGICPLWRSWIWSQLADCSERRTTIEQCVALVLCRLSGHQQTRKGKRQSSSEPRPSGEWEKRVEENWGFLWSPTLQIRGAERGSKWLVLCGGCDTLKSQSHLQHSFHQVH